MRPAPGLGKIGVLVALESGADKAALRDARQAARDAHRRRQPAGADAARSSTPTWSSASAAIATEKARESGKPAEIVEKMVEGAMAKFRKENALLSQLFVMDNKTKVADVIAGRGEDAGRRRRRCKAYVRFQLGEGIEKKVDDFAAEVAAASGVGRPEPVA